MVEPIESKRRSRTTLIATTVGVVAAAALVVYGFSQSDDDRDTSIPPTIGVIQAPAEVFTTQPLVQVPSGSAPLTADVPVFPLGTDDVEFPPISSDILVP